MTKSELKTGHIVTMRDGDEYMVFRNCSTSCFNGDMGVKIPDGGHWIKLDDYNDDLTLKDDWRACDIMKVEEIWHPCGVINDDDGDRSERETIWERKEKKKYTYAQLREILGEEFEVIG